MDMFSFLLGTFLREELMGHMVTLCLTFEEQPNFSTVTAAFTFPPAAYEGSYFSTLTNTHFLIFVIIKAVLVNMK